MSQEKLDEFLYNGKDWNRLKTSIPGVFVLKLPVYKRTPSRLAVELNPVDGAGNPTKRRGLVLRTTQELEAFNELYHYDRLTKLLGMLDQVNLKAGRRGTRKRQDVIEL